MIQTIISGIGLGLGLAIVVGPAFFSLLQTSIDKGFRSARRLALGIFVSDVFLVAVAFLGAASLLGRPMVKEIVGLVGGGVLVGIGAHTFLHRSAGRHAKCDPKMEELTSAENTAASALLSKPLPFFVKGFLLNLANPAAWFFWISSVGLVSTQYADSMGRLDIVSLLIFFLCTLFTVLGTDVLKAYVAGQLKKWINDSFITRVNMLFGIGLIGFGALLVLRSVYPIIELMWKYLPTHL